MSHSNQSKTADAARDLAERAGQTADDVLLAARRTTGDVADEVESGIDTLRQKVPQAISHAATQVGDAARRGVERARDAGAAVRDQAVHAGDQTVAYIKDEPVKSVLIAAAAGAFVTMLLTLMTSRRH